MKYVTSTENQRTFNNITQYIPTRDEAKDIFNSQPYMAQLAGYTQFANQVLFTQKGVMLCL